MKLLERLKTDPRTHGLWRALGWPVALGLFGRLEAIQRSAVVRIGGPGAQHVGAAVYVHWHRYAPFLIAHHGRHRRWMLVGRAPYLQPLVLWCQLQGLRTLPVGSEGRVGLVAALLRGESVTLAVDGPKGPAFEPKSGCLELARAAKVPLIPVAYTSARGRTDSRRWDRALVPSLFDRIVVTYGAPIAIDETASTADALSRIRQGLDALSPSTSAATG